MGKATWRSSSNSGSDGSSSPSEMSFQSKATARKLKFDDDKAVVRSPQSPRNYPDVDPEDAQSVYPPEWCVFVAK